VQAMELDWNRVPDSIKPDVVLLSDVNYNPGQFDGLLQLITKLIANGTIVLLSTPQRIMASPFVNAIQELVKQSHVEIVNENGKSIEISILILFK
jgi:predicted nicotinamide N-methyase